MEKSAHNLTMRLIRLEYADAKLQEHRIDAVPALEKVNSGPYINNVHPAFPRAIGNKIHSFDFYGKHPVWEDDRLDDSVSSPEHVFGFMTKEQFNAWFDVKEKLLELSEHLRVAFYEGPPSAFHHGKKQSIADVNHLELEKVLAIEEFLE